MKKERPVKTAFSSKGLAPDDKPSIHEAERISRSLQKEICRCASKCAEEKSKDQDAYVSTEDLIMAVRNDCLHGCAGRVSQEVFDEALMMAGDAPRELGSGLTIKQKIVNSFLDALGLRRKGGRRMELSPTERARIAKREAQDLAEDIQRLELEHRRQKRELMQQVLAEKVNRHDGADAFSDAELALLDEIMKGRGAGENIRDAIGMTPEQAALLANPLASPDDNDYEFDLKEVEAPWKTGRKPYLSKDAISNLFPVAIMRTEEMAGQRDLAIEEQWIRNSMVSKDFNILPDRERDREREAAADLQAELDARQIPSEYMDLLPFGPDVISDWTINGLVAWPVKLGRREKKERGN